MSVVLYFYMFIHLGYFYSASASLLLLIGDPGRGKTLIRRVVEWWG